MATITQANGTGGDPIATLIAQTSPGFALYDTVSSSFYKGTRVQNDQGVFYTGGITAKGHDLAYPNGTPHGGTVTELDVHPGLQFPPTSADTYTEVRITGLSLSATAAYDIIAGYNAAAVYNFVYETKWTWYGSSIADSFSGGRYGDNLNAGGGNDVALGAGGDDTIDGGAGRDTMIGGTGDDVFYADVSQDSVRERSGEGHDTVYAANGFGLAVGASVEVLAADPRANAIAMTLLGNEISQAIIGNDAKNTMLGEDGKDTLTGSGGADILAGNFNTTADDKDRDVFRYVHTGDSGTSESTRDEIWGSFNGGGSNHDLIDLSKIDANGSYGSGNGTFHFIGSADFKTSQIGEVRVSKSGDGYLVRIDTDKDNSSEMTIFVHTDHALVKGDFIL